MNDVTRRWPPCLVAPPVPAWCAVRQAMARWRPSLSSLLIDRIPAMPSDEEAQISTPPHTPPHPAAPAATAPAPAAVAATSAPPPRTSTPTLASHHPSTEPPSHSHPSCPSCGEVPGEYVSLAEYRRTMSIVRLQVSVPISSTFSGCGRVSVVDGTHSFGLTRHNAHLRGSH